MRAKNFSYFDDPFVAMAHRGGYLKEEDKDRENSIYAFRNAVNAGYRYLETDVHATSDGKLIAFHDPILDRVTDGSGLVAATPYSTIKRLKIAGIDPIPTLDEVLEEFPDSRINIDIKNPLAISALVSAIERHKAYDRVCIASFSQRNLWRFRRKFGNTIAYSLSTLAVIWSMVPFLPKFVNFNGEAFQIPSSQLVARINVPVVTKRLISLAHARDMRVHVWTVNEPLEMRRLISMGVDGIISDNIGALKSIAQEYGIWQHS